MAEEIKKEGEQNGGDKIQEETQNNEAQDNGATNATQDTVEPTQQTVADNSGASIAMVIELLQNIILRLERLEKGERNEEQKNPNIHSPENEYNLDGTSPSTSGQEKNIKEGETEKDYDL